MSLQYDPQAPKVITTNQTDWRLVVITLLTATLGVWLHIDRMDSGDLMVCLITLLWSAKKVFQKV